MKYIKTFLFGLLLVPQFASAQLLACTGAADCNFCALVETFDNIVRFITMIIIFCCVLLLMYAGFKLVTSAGNPSAKDEAKKLFTNVVIGFIIVLSAWTVVDTLLKAVVSSDAGLGVWNEISPENCGGHTADGGYSGVVDRADESGGSGLSVVDGGTGEDTLGGASVTGNLVNYGGYQFDSGVVEHARYLDTQFDLRVSSGYRDEARNAAVGGAANSYHLTGRAIDLVGSRSAMEAGKAWAQANGAREVLIHDAGSGTHLHVAF